MSFQNVCKAAVSTAAFFVSFLVLPSFAGTFQVTPVRVELSATRGTAALTVSNNGSAAVVIQLQSAAWAQEAGVDQYSPTDDLIATPPIFTIQPGANQVVRVGLRRRPDANTELSYRLYLQEVPPAPELGFQGLQVALRIGIPVFVEPSLKTSASLSFAAQKNADNTLTVVTKNTSKAHVQVTDFKINLLGQEQAIATQQVSFYLLPLQERSWVLALDPKKKFSAKTVHVTAYTDAGTMETDVILDQP